MNKTSPGGPSVSEAKQRRLAALDKAFNKSKAQSSSTAAASPNNAQKQAAKSAAKRRAQTHEAVPAGKRPRDQKPGKRDAGDNARSDVRDGVRPPSPLSSSIVDQQHAQQSVVASEDAVFYEPLPAAVLHSTAAHALQLGGDGSCSGGLMDVVSDAMATRANASRDGRTTIVSRLQDRVVMLDNPSQPTTTASCTKYTGGLLSRRQRKRLGLDVAALHCSMTLDIAHDMHAAWQRYMAQLMAHSAASSSQHNGRVEDAVMQADMHGARIEVADCKHTQLIGMKGVVFSDTSAAYHIMRDSCKTSIVAKQGTVIRVFLPDGVTVLVHCANLCAALGKPLLHAARRGLTWAL